jgi:C-terminal processing protease CtpA/Prc
MKRRSIVQNQICRKKKRFSTIGIKVEWDGPLVIMVNSFSASASEILAQRSRL